MLVYRGWGLGGNLAAKIQCSPRCWLIPSRL